jgi:hypothetical protein
MWSTPEERLTRRRKGDKKWMFVIESSLSNGVSYKV